MHLSVCIWVLTLPLVTRSKDRIISPAVLQVMLECAKECYIVHFGHQWKQFDTVDVQNKLLCFYTDGQTVGQICCLWLVLKLNLGLDTDWNPLTDEWCFPMLPQLADDGMQRSECDQWQQNLSVCLRYVCGEKGKAYKGEKKERERGRAMFPGKDFYKPQDSRYRSLSFGLG